MVGILQALRAIGDLMGQQVRNRNAAAATVAGAPPVNQPVGVVNDGYLAERLVEQFLKLKPPKFSRSGDPEAAISWIEELEKAFDLLRCTNEDKVILAVYRLQGTASTWWRASKDRVFPEGTVPTWDAFVEAFNGKYFSDNVRDQKMAEFFRLRRNRMTIDRYEARFEKLSKYAPRLVEDPMDRARRFRDKLKPEIEVCLIPFNPKDYNDLYERAQMVEQDLIERAAASRSRFAPSNRRDIRQGKRPMQGNRFNVPPNRRGVISKPMPRRDDVCRLCNQRYGSAPCGMRGVCFGCGRRGHLVSTPLKDIVIAAVSRPGCRLVVDGHESEIDLVVLEMYDFDLIVGMDWLTKQRATMDCYHKAIQFRPLDGAGFEFVGNQGGTSIVVISSLEATRLLESGCQGYLAAIVDTSIGETKLEDIAVVCEFPDVFPEELPGLPPKREMEFVIELALGTEPISKALYRMTLSDLMELKVQLSAPVRHHGEHPCCSSRRRTGL
ncbi:uncharacterized protein LOC125314113 [Rhodamnia argentea]|uniref:Uncharacterized protein LOC125314113 n=1 Tax=Rhodamnia argentea TaxID=178133 RepID=A0ABM3H4N2_9MYRT|nr:uncharacterized protein LOC125314113 [Rhodamnia argentea]